MTKAVNIMTILSWTFSSAIDRIFPEKSTDQLTNLLLTLISLSSHSHEVSEPSSDESFLERSTTLLQFDHNDIRTRIQETGDF